ncbi:hypothetical protein BDN71DRAFT_1436795 [Pleurotus eryngii]|uniref:Uncharacterized protein n=1 Tax=Pleurotus eryngii TaxID=5323 RepID=A0A9P6D9C4_PLEER|nr:hypothetical protein BDN71DRAFT_1436795 [Pleurotus eryngii]
MGIKAKLDQLNPTKPLTMGEGDIDAGILWDWFNKCKAFFHHKNLTTDNCIVLVTWDTLEVNMDQELAHECNRENMNSITLFQDWLKEVKRLDKHHRQHLKEIEHTLAKINVKTTTTCTLPLCTPFQNKNTPASSSTPSSTFVPISKLLDSKRALLIENGGCYKCRHFWTGHVGARCTVPPIDGSKYKTLTARDVPPWPVNYSTHGNVSRTAVVALLQAQSNNSDKAENMLPTNDSVNAVVAVMPKAKGLS